MTNLTNRVLKKLEGFRLNVTLDLDVDYDVYSEMDIKAILKAEQAELIKKINDLEKRFGKNAYVLQKTKEMIEGETRRSRPVRRRW